MKSISSPCEDKPDILNVCSLKGGIESFWSSNSSASFNSVTLTAKYNLDKARKYRVPYH